MGGSRRTGPEELPPRAPVLIGAPLESRDLCTQVAFHRVGQDVPGNAALIRGPEQHGYPDAQRTGGCRVRESPGGTRP